MSPIGATSALFVLLSLAGVEAYTGAFVVYGGALKAHGKAGSRRSRPTERVFMNKGFGVAKKPVKKKKSKGSGGGASEGKKVDRFLYTGKMRPGTLSPRRPVPSEIPRPDYADDGVPKLKSMGLPWTVEVKNEKDIAGMRASGRIAREVLDLCGKAVVAGATTDDIDRVCHEAAIGRGAYPSPLNYQGFPKSCCTSVDEIICHGIPDSTILTEGMIINVDVTVYYKGYHGDCSEMFTVGKVDEAARDLIQTTYDAWQEAIAYCKPGRHYKGIGAVIQDYVEARGYSTVRNFCGHGIGKIFHCAPNILHYRNNEPNGIMKPGQTFTIEPMICEGTAKNIMWPDKWTAATSDGKRTAQFEHTLLITEDGVEPLTAKLDASPRNFWEKRA